MVSIIRSSGKDALLLSGIAKLSFLESHGHSAGPEDIAAYASANYTPGVLKEELADSANIYHIIYYNKEAAGFSKIILDHPYEGSKATNITKMERLYLLKKFYGLSLGSQLFEFNINFIKEKNQAGIWLYTWKENHRAIRFYEKKGFTIIGSHDFRLSATHSNPNHQMLLNF